MYTRQLARFSIWMGRNYPIQKRREQYTGDGPYPWICVCRHDGKRGEKLTGCKHNNGTMHFEGCMSVVHRQGTRLNLGALHWRDLTDSCGRIN